jgi:hypothetical protein
MKEVPGLINAKNAKPANPKPSPKDFVWPSQRDADESVAKKIAATLQELLPERGWKHVDLAKALWGTQGANDAPRNTQAVRRWVVADLPIPSERDAAYTAQVLDIPMSRLLEPEGKFNPLPPMIRPRSDSPRFHPEIAKQKKPMKKKSKKAGTTPSGRDRAKQRAYNAAYRAKKRAAKGEPSYYMRKKLEKLKAKGKRAKSNGHSGDSAGWVLADGVAPPVYKISSDTASDAPPGYVSIELTATLPHERAMAIVHMLQHEAEE